MSLRRWATLGAIVCGLLLAVAARGADPLFEPRADFGTGDHPYSLAVADLNRDGHRDLVITNEDSNSVSVLLGDGNGSLGGRRDFDTATNPKGVAIADLDRDGKQDVVVACALSNQVSVLLGDGSGALGARHEFATGSAPRSVAIGDYDRDGKWDLAVANQGPDDDVSVLLGNGDGTFRAKVDYPAGSDPHAVAAGDLNQDGWLDLVVANVGSSSITVLIGLHGGGAFASNGDTPVPVYPLDVAIGDVNGDGALDVVAASHIDAKLAVLLGNGGGGFSNQVECAARAPFAVAIGDLNIDGRADIVASSEDTVMTVVLSRSDGTFAPGLEFATPGNSTGLVLGDLNEDGVQDVVVGNVDARNVSVFVNRSREPTIFGNHFHYDAGSEPLGIAMGDVDRDGCEDVATANPGDGTVSLLLGNCVGGLRAAHLFAAGSGASDIALGDFDRDGSLDVVTAGAVLLGDGAGAFGAPRPFDPIGDQVVTHDLNRDGRLDLAIRAGYTVVALLGDGAGGFGAPIAVPVQYNATSLAVGDLDRDGIPDLAVGSTYIFQQMFLGNGDGTFRPGWFTYPDPLGGGETHSIALGDVNRDGMLDMVCAGSYVVHHGSWGVQVFLGDGAGGFSSSQIYMVCLCWPNFPPGPALVALADLDVNGKLDMIVDNVIWRGDGSGQFFPDMTLNITVSRVAFADLNRDAAPDLALTGWDGTVTVFLNRSLTVLVEVEDLQAGVVQGHARVAWRISDAALNDIEGIDVERAAAAEGPYEKRTAAPLEPAALMSWDDSEADPGCQFWYRLALVGADGSCVYSGPVSAKLESAPLRTALHAVAEPAGGGPIRIRYDIASPLQNVRLAIHDVRGRELWSSVRAVREPGEQEQVWNRQDRAGARVSRGVYFVRLDAAGVTKSRKLVLLHR